MSEADVPQWLTGVCAPPCPGRSVAMGRGEFEWLEEVQGWHIPSWARATGRERYYAVDVLFTECPWCGRTLPTPTGRTPEMEVTDGDVE